ncbi:MAG: winged helix-turn-helix transcriptional regulator [Natronohydrobacter sp.]|nr:winged helix-turn-helix transcriptional regulator [Natronohydrobacter sp.]
MPDDERLAALAKALAHPTRLKILALLVRTPGCIGGDFVQAVGLAQSTVSEHLRILKAAGVIEGQIDPPRVCYALAPDALAPTGGADRRAHLLRHAGPDLTVLGNGLMVPVMLSLLWFVNRTRQRFAA